MKKVIAVLLAVVTVITLLAGCSTKPTITETENSSNIEVSKSAAEETESSIEAETTTEAETTAEKPTETIIVETTTEKTTKKNTTSTTKKSEITTKIETTTKKKETTTKKATATTESPYSEWSKTVKDNNKDLCLSIFELVNKERKKAGVEPLAYRYELQAGADLRAKELAQSFSHTRPNGSKCQTVFKDLGLSNSIYYAENIAMASGFVYTPEMAMYSWMNSSGHKANILNENAYGIVVGVTEINGSTYWVQLFDCNWKKGDPAEHNHDWQAEYEQRQVLVKEAWDEPVYGTNWHNHGVPYTCVTCGKVFGIKCNECGYVRNYGPDESDTGNNAMTDYDMHIINTGHEWTSRPKSNENVPYETFIGYEHHDAEYETESYIAYYYCSLNACGARKDP